MENSLRKRIVTIKNYRWPLKELKLDTRSAPVASLLLLVLVLRKKKTALQAISVFC